MQFQLTYELAGVELPETIILDGKTVEQARRYARAMMLINGAECARIRNEEGSIVRTVLSK